MNRIDSIFSEQKKALMPFLVAGFPSREVTEGAILAMSDAGADIIEIGIPFSDPIADGPVIAAAMHDALQLGVTPAEIAKIIERVRTKVECGLVAMVSFSIVKKIGMTTFVDLYANAGIDGFILPDIDEVEATGVSEYCRRLGLSFSMLIAPTTPLHRVEKLASLSSGFLYVLARTGLTGTQTEMPELHGRLQEIRKVTNLPLAVGFGISTADHVRCVHEIADAAIVGSALVAKMEGAEDPVKAAAKFVSDIS